MLRFDLLQAPREDGQVLIEPSASEWMGSIEQVVRGRPICQAGLELAGVDVRSVRQDTRRRLFGGDLTEPVIACGHQSEFIHPGVWAKHVVVHHATESLGILGVDLVVDHDAPRSTGLAVPARSEAGLLERRSIPVLTGISGSAYEGRPPLCPSAMDSLLEQVRRAIGSAMTDSESSCIGEYCRGLAAAERPRDFVDQHLAGRHRLDRTLAADLWELRVSNVFDGPFVADILLNLDRFAHEYNSALAEYRQRQQVRSPDRPLPDLKRLEGRLEAPFWIYQPLQQRRRLWVAFEGDELAICADDQPAGRLSRGDLMRNATAALASLAPWVVRPRALTLTLWARLLVCDFFVHGIGGAKYDRITDSLFRRYYACEPPPYACVTATLRLPVPSEPVSREDVIAARRRIRDVQFNPQRYTDAAPASLAAERDEWIRQSTRLRDSGGSRIARREAFHHIRRLNAEVLELAPETAGRVTQKASQVEAGFLSSLVAANREFFYALQPRARLEMLASRLIDACHGSAVQT